MHAGTLGKRVNEASLVHQLYKGVDFRLKIELSN